MSFFTLVSLAHGLAGPDAFDMVMGGIEASGNASSDREAGRAGDRKQVRLTSRAVAMHSADAPLASFCLRHVCRR